MKEINFKKLQFTEKCDPGLEVSILLLDYCTLYLTFLCAN